MSRCLPGTVVVCPRSASPDPLPLPSPPRRKALADNEALRKRMESMETLLATQAAQLNKALDKAYEALEQQQMRNQEMSEKMYLWQRKYVQNKDAIEKEVVANK